VPLGGAGADPLIGGGGRNLLPGGLGADTLNASRGDEPLIGGRTAFDANGAAPELREPVILPAPLTPGSSLRTIPPIGLAG
jgi:Ca2+-binding RTX toxin-like protein